MRPPAIRGATALFGAYALCYLLMVLPGSLMADGGTLRAANVPMGAYRVNVYTDPTPIRPDSIDVSVLVTFERGRGVAVGLDIQVVGTRLDGPPTGGSASDGPATDGPATGGPATEGSPSDGSGLEVRHPATREQAEDPRYYAAKFALGSVGLWEIRVLVKGPEGEGETAFRVTVQEAGLFSSPFLILAVALLPLLLVGLWFRQTRSPSTHSPQASSPSSHPEG